MPNLCTKCLSTDQHNETCRICGGRVRAHPELFDLSVAHIDADAFYASVEKRDDPALRDVPVIVGSKSGRGVVTTACYIARQYGVRSAQPMYQALKACPDAVVVPPNFDKYREVSSAIREMMHALTPQVQTASLDEAYLDLHATERLHGAPPAVLLARLANRVQDELGVTVSVGLSHAPFLAKIASDLEKPCGFSVIGKDETLSFLEDKPVAIIGGVGGKTAQALRDLRIQTIGDLRRADPVRLYRAVGSSSAQLLDFAHGVDKRRVEPNPPAKSISAETTFERDTASASALERAIWPLCEKVSSRAKAGGVVGDTITLKLKQADHKSLTRQLHLDAPTQLAEDLYQSARTLIRKAPPRASFRLVGVGLSGLQDAGSVTVQKGLFDDGSQRREAAERALDAIRAKWGDGAAFKGRSLK